MQLFFYHFLFEVLFDQSILLSKMDRSTLSRNSTALMLFFCSYPCTSKSQIYSCEIFPAKDPPFKNSSMAVCKTRSAVCPMGMNIIGDR